ncbi:Arc family DNA-binding protein [Endozoicomonas gorgoniicola]|uniref:Arc family DNA-binding protein n=1 Tax=Endozoicomonas gorgoniicola TaxID=1234144 RepID=A0ABT3MRA6_9GAMM|nr:Arc family DNA-binding protein [Endozoicomonas gorgoniicola]MCW7551668.1 Arc family DNA-binding protein [Endozoicomonas gorgoniicola]
MPALTIKNIPDSLYKKLKEAASAHHRSINSELIHCLEQMLLPKRVSPAEHLKKARELRQGIDSDMINVDDIHDAIDRGRA